MRKAAKALFLVIVSLLASITLAVASAFTAALAFGAVALIVPGTGTHDVLTAPIYRQNAATRYVDPAGTPVCGGSPASCNTVGVDYPATFFPLVIFSGWCPGLSCDTWNKSVGTGVTNLDMAVHQQLAADLGQQVVIFGYSQGGAVVSQELYNLNQQLSEADKKRVSVVTIGNINNPQGLWSRLSFLPTIPFLDISFNPQLPTTGIPSTNYSFEYDPVGDAPLYFGNPLAVLNALAAFEYVHGYYLSPNENGVTDTLPYGYTPDTLATAIANADKRTYQDATFVLIPQQGNLPIMQPFLDIASATGTTALVKPIVDLLSPLTKVLINLGYDRIINPGIPQTLSILPFNPFQNWLGVGVNLAAATVQGIQAFLGDLGIALPPAAPAPAPQTTTMLAKSAAPLAATVQKVAATTEQDQSKVTALASAEKSTPETPETVEPVAKDVQETQEGEVTPVVVPVTKAETTTESTTPAAVDVEKKDEAKDTAKDADAGKKDEAKGADAGKKDQAKDADAGKKDEAKGADAGKKDQAKDADAGKKPEKKDATDDAGMKHEKKDAKDAGKDAGADASKKAAA
jgi:hypothetical protein